MNKNLGEIHFVYRVVLNRKVCTPAECHADSCEISGDHLQSFCGATVESIAEVR